MKRLFNHQCNSLFRLALLVLLLGPFAAEAPARQQAANAEVLAFKLEVTLASEHVRFRASEGTVALRLEVLNEAGELVYDSGEVMRAELLWGMKDTSDKPLQGGLYSYTLTVKRAEGEAGTKRGGHLIIEQTGGRVWLTSRDNVGIDGGPNASVISGDRDGVVAGVVVSSSKAAATGPVTETTANKIALQTRANADGGKGEVVAPSLLAVDGTGTVGRIPKWTTATGIGNSVITESSNGRIGIGTTAPAYKLDVRVNLGGAISGSGTTGVYGVSPVAGHGVVGQANQGFGVSGSSETSYGVSGTSGGSVGVSGYGPIYGVLGETPNGTAVYGKTGTGTGVSGITTSGIGVYGTSSTSAGVLGTHTGTSGTLPGVWGETDSEEAFAAGVLGRVNATDPGPGSAAVLGLNSGRGPSGIGVRGAQAGSGWGVQGEAPSGRGVFGSSSSGQGVYGLSVTDAGVRGYGFFGVYGEAPATSFAGIYGYAPTGGSGWVPYAGYFAGNVHVSGTLSKAGGSFKIDHPVDPENKYLYHSFVESPDMKNIYDGVVTTDASGDAIVMLPDWFEALNRDFRYQLTVIGGFAQAIVSSEVEDNQFAVKTSAPKVKVSWQITGIRRDAWANKNRIPIEEAKPESERGLYLHPEVFGKPEEARITWKLHSEVKSHR